MRLLFVMFILAVQSVAAFPGRRLDPFPRRRLEPHNCCHSRFGQCQDGTGGTPYCGYGPCNFLGCHCSGGCRQLGGPSAQLARRSADTQKPLDSDMQQLSADDILKESDKDNNGLIDIAEVREYLHPSSDISGNPKLATLENQFEALDMNHDGFLDVNEIDPPQ